VTRRRRVYEILEGDDLRDRMTVLVRYGIITVILLNVGFAIIETIPALGDDWDISFRVLEAISFVVFVGEFAARIWVCVEDPRLSGLPPARARMRFLRSPDAIIDMIAILPFFIARIFPADLRTLALLRLLRILKLMRYSTGITSLFEAIWSERHTLVSCLFVLLVAVITSATLIYLAEGDTQPKAFGSIPLSMWWAIVTLTTVGYGDVVPVTPIGRMIGGVTVVLGLIVLALPIAIVATSFAEVIRRRGFVVNWATLSRLPLFAGLESNLIGEILSVVQATSFDAGDVILRRGENASALHVIAIGDAEIETGDVRARIGDGAMFGGRATPEAARGDVVVRALTRTRMLILAADEVEALARRWPKFAARLAETTGGAARPAAAER
jgi:voltage-gated potassium channel